MKMSSEIKVSLLREFRNPLNGHKAKGHYTIHSMCYSPNGKFICFSSGTNTGIIGSDEKVFIFPESIQKDNTGNEWGNGERMSVFSKNSRMLAFTVPTPSHGWYGYLYDISVFPYKKICDIDLTHSPTPVICFSDDCTRLVTSEMQEYKIEGAGEYTSAELEKQAEKHRLELLRLEHYYTHRDDKSKKQIEF